MLRIVELSGKRQTGVDRRSIMELEESQGGRGIAFYEEVPGWASRWGSS
jgi:hypothetical protein